MAKLKERRPVKCPYARAAEFLAEALTDAAASGETQTIRLRAAFRELNFEKDVLVHYAKGKDPMHLEQPWNVEWTPMGGGPYPDFKGTLTVRETEEYTASVLELDGDYEPPGGAAGQIFDAVVGHRIASSTGQMLLDEIGTRMEERHRQEEAAKK